MSNDKPDPLVKTVQPSTLIWYNNGYEMPRGVFLIIVYKRPHHRKMRMHPGILNRRNYIELSNDTFCELSDVIAWARPEYPGMPVNTAHDIPAMEVVE